MAATQLKDLPQRFQDKIMPEPMTGCWIWIGARSRLNYGHVRVGEKIIEAHIAVFNLTRGRVPEGHELDHGCRLRPCVNPQHVEPVTHVVNMARGINGTKTHCINGHEFIPENTMIFSNGSRNCRACAKDRQERWKAKNGYH